jgi:hypothetical protein
MISLFLLQGKWNLIGQKTHDMTLQLTRKAAPLIFSFDREALA